MGAQREDGDEDAAGGGAAAPSRGPDRPVGLPDVAAGEYPVAEPDGFDGTLGFEVLEMRDDFARGRMAVTDRVRQRFGLVHGGAYAGLAEMLASEATVQAVWGEGSMAMGASNHTSFLRPIRDGYVHATARRRHRGLTSWLWDVELTDDRGRLCATSQVTVAVRRRPPRAGGG